MQARAHAEKLFLLIDLDGDGKLTSKEFLRVGLVWSDVILFNVSYLVTPGMSAGSNFTSETGEDN